MGNFVRTLGRQKMLSQTPVVVILGCTGTGKSKLAIELAKKFNGEIISADSMQVYKGLDIITNKVTPAEQEEVVHHCIDWIDPLSRYTVVDFRKQALPLINSLLEDRKVPIIVGGTNYYIESLLWNVLLGNEDIHDRLLFDVDKEHKTRDPLGSNSSDVSVEDLLKQKILPDSFENVSSSVLHKCLQEVDAAMANALHPSDRRKIIRSLQVYQQHGRTHSEMLQQQRLLAGGSSLGGPLRFQNSVMLWIQCEKEVLIKRLNDRVDEMLKRGLVAELLDFHNSYNEKRIDAQNPQYTEGIFQSIGFKEFHDYLILSEEERNSPNGKKVFERAVEDMKIRTRQYARKQTKWVLNRFLRKPDRKVPPVYDLQATNLEKWSENVFLPAVEIVQAVLEGRTPSQSPMPLENPLNDVAETHFCEVCDQVLVGRRVWEIHINSKKHRRRKSKLQKAEGIMPQKNANSS